MPNKKQAPDGALYVKLCCIRTSYFVFWVFFFPLTMTIYFTTILYTLGTMEEEVPLTVWIHEHYMYVSWATLRSNIWFLSFLYLPPVSTPLSFPLPFMVLIIIIMWTTDMSKYWYIVTNLITNHPFNGALNIAKATSSPFSVLMLKFASLICLAGF